MEVEILTAVIVWYWEYRNDSFLPASRQKLSWARPNAGSNPALSAIYYFKSIIYEQVVILYLAITTVVLKGILGRYWCCFSQFLVTKLPKF
jgi:hypothetical protein